MWRNKNLFGTKVYNLLLSHGIYMAQNRFIWPITVQPLVLEGRNASHWGATPLIWYRFHMV
jgi:hypothetical protein